MRALSDGPSDVVLDIGGSLLNDNAGDCGGEEGCVGPANAVGLASGPMGGESCREPLRLGLFGVCET